MSEQMLRVEARAFQAALLKVGGRGLENLEQGHLRSFVIPSEIENEAAAAKRHEQSAKRERLGNGESNL
jgi:hypothetical protein